MHFLLFLCTGFAIISKAASSPGYLGYAQEREEADITKKGKCTESYRFLVQVEKMTRKELWKHCFRVPFSVDFYPTQEEATAQLGQYFQSSEEDDVDESGIFQVLHKIELKETDSEYLQTRIVNITEKIPEIDGKLNQAAIGWKTKRMGKAELTISRLALCGMLHDDAIPEKVSINEAVELAKKFGGDDSPSLVNRIPAKLVVKGARVAAEVKVPEENRVCGETQEPRETQASQEIQVPQETRVSQEPQETSVPREPQEIQASQEPQEISENKESEAQAGRMASVYTISQVTAYIRNMFTQDFVLNRAPIRGKVSNCKYHTSGHIYFTLKDGGTQIAAAMFVEQGKELDFELREGQEVTVSGTVDVYERDGRYQLYAEEITRKGKGDLFRQFGKLRNELEEMGMLDSCYKQPIPKYARKVGIVMAGTEAAIRDIMNISARRNPYVQFILYPVLVQGEQAKYSIARGIETLDRMGLGVLIVGRGGGSIGDLQAFNEEMVVRAIFNCTTPIILAVGHETDVTIADYVADLRALAPSAAAELAVFDCGQFVEQVNLCRQVLERSMERRLEKLHFRLDQCGMRLKLLNLEKQFNDRRQRLADMESRLERMMKENLGLSRRKLEDRRRRPEACMALELTEGEHRLILLSGRLDGLSPPKRLGDGFGFVTDAEGRAFTSITQAESGNIIRVSVKDGRVDARIVETESMRLPGSEGQRMPCKKTDTQEKEENKASIEENSAQLEETIKKLETGDSTLEESFICYEVGMRLVKYLSGQIGNVGKQIQISSEGDENE